MIAVDGGSTAQYHYNAIGQRIVKQTQNQTLLFTYDQTGKLLGEYSDNQHNLITQQETIWLGNLPVATVKDNIPYAIHSDHLGTPRLITDPQQHEIWQLPSDPFGATTANEAAFTYNLRFAGQYYDKETGLHYNYFRYYDPKTGRYRVSDLIGLAGGLNTYAYVGNNPVNWVDPLGLKPGDRFNTPNETAIDTLDYYNPLSIQDNAEYGGSICKEIGSSTKYFAIEATKGKGDTVSTPSCPCGSERVAKYHTHGDYSKKGFIRTTKPNDYYHSDDFSPEDKKNDKYLGYFFPDYIGGYLGTPSGSYKFYDPRSNTTETIK